MSQNHNSFLTLTLSESLVNMLSEVAVELKTVIDAQISSRLSSFSPMERDFIHVTFLFCGEHLNRIPAADLTKWHNGVQKLVNEYRCPPIEEGIIKVTRLDLFPPQKKNLVVAIMEATKTLYSLQLEIVELTAAMGVRNEAFSHIASLNQDWQPHCTLGKIQADKLSVSLVGSLAIDEVKAKGGSYDRLIHDQTFSITGLSLSGYTPKQKWIDWNSSLCFND